MGTLGANFMNFMNFMNFKKFIIKFIKFKPTIKFIKFELHNYVDRQASEEVTLQLVRIKCMPMLLYALECFVSLESDVRSLDFAVTRFLMKLFETSNIGIIKECRSNVTFLLPSERLETRKTNFESKFNKCNSLIYYYGL